jgi:hypothetical protein
MIQHGVVTRSKFGRVKIGSQTKRLFAVNFADLGEQRLKNIAEPVRAYAVRPPSASILTEAVPSQAPPPAALPPENVLPFADQDKFTAGLVQAVGGGATADEARLSEPSASSRRLPEASQASAAKNWDAPAGSSPIESAPHRQVETPNVLQWPGRRRA